MGDKCYEQRYRLTMLGATISEGDDAMTLAQVPTAWIMSMCDRPDRRAHKGLNVGYPRDAGHLAQLRGDGSWHSSTGEGRGCPKAIHPS